MNIRVKTLLIILICSCSLKIYANAILDDNLASIPDVTIENNIDLDFDFNSGTLEWVNNSLPISKLTLLSLPPNTPIDNFSRDPSKDSSKLINDLLKALQIGDLSNKGEINLANNQFNTVISNLMLVSKQRKNSGIVPQPETLILIIIGLIILFNNFQPKNIIA